jgi:hypothetical protein
LKVPSSIAFFADSAVPTATWWSLGKLGDDAEAHALIEGHRGGRAAAVLLAAQLQKTLPPQLKNAKSPDVSVR